MNDGPRSSALTAVLLRLGQMMTPDKEFLSRSHVIPRHDSLNTFQVGSRLLSSATHGRETAAVARIAFRAERGRYDLAGSQGR
jgi:hypothetical protein